MNENIFQAALQHHQAGRLADAEFLYRQLLDQQPDHAPALHHLGLLAHQAGDHDAAIELMGRAIALAPAPDAYSNLGIALQAQGRLEEAIASFHHALQLKPDFPEAYYNMGNALAAAGRTADAIAAFRRAIELRFVYPEAHNNLGAALKSAGQVDDAVAAHRQAIALKPDYARAHHNLGVALRAASKPAEAIAAFQRAMALAPRFAEAQHHLAAALAESGRGDEAITAFGQALAMAPHFPESHHRLANLLRDKGRLEEAVAEYRAAIALHPADPQLHLDLGATLLLKSDPAAEAALREAVALDSSSAHLWNALGAALNCLGKFEEASACFRRALEISPEARFYRGLLSTGRNAASAGEIGRLVQLVARSDVPLEERITAEFSLGRMLDEAGRFDDAFAHFAAANRLFKESRATAGLRFDAGALEREVSRRIATFTPNFFAARRAWGNPAEAPVFIVGMPRSGTSLVEQIAASHPDVFGAGELQTIEQAPLAGMPPHLWDGAAIAGAAGAYLAHIHSIASRPARRITDKMPNNIFHLGLIGTMFPGARVIFCRRDAVDNCLSCFFQQFDGDNILFSYDLADCARQCLETQRLAAHWIKALPLRMLEIQYESLIAAQETESRRLIEFLGLPWHPACLNFHQQQRPVMTASVWQVRQPIYTRSVGRWHDYQRHLGPLLNALKKTTESGA